MALLTSLKYMTILDTNHAVLSTAVNDPPGPSGYQHTWYPSWVSIPGQDKTMLDDDDATSLCKATSSLADPILEIKFGTAQQISAFGLLNHNLSSSGVKELYLEYHTGTVWTRIDSTAYTFPGGDRDIALAFNTETRTRFRFTMRGTGDTGVTPTAFYMGYVYWGRYYQFTRNPVQFIQTRRPAIRYLQSAGGMTHAIKGMEYRPSTLEMNFVRAKGADLQVLTAPHLSRNIFGVIPPDVVPDPSVAPVGNDIFYGRLEEMSLDPQTPSNIGLSNEVYNTQVLMRGAV